MPSAGFLVIGNEILSGKVVDTNSPFLAKQLREIGVDLDRILTIPDDIDVIAREVRKMSDDYDHVMTSGGIGPTHDDITVECIAKAFGVEVEQNPVARDLVLWNQRLTSVLNETITVVRISLKMSIFALECCRTHQKMRSDP